MASSKCKFNYQETRAGYFGFVLPCSVTFAYKNLSSQIAINTQLIIDVSGSSLAVTAAYTAASVAAADGTTVRGPAVN